MPYRQGNVLWDLASSYTPLASGIPYQPNFGFEGTPLADYPMLGMLLQQPMTALMGKAGFAPMGFNDRNYADILQNQQFFKMQQDLQKQMAETDRAGWMSSLRGIAHMTGTPWGADQRRAATALTDAYIVARRPS